MKQAPRHLGPSPLRMQPWMPPAVIVGYPVGVTAGQILIRQVSGPIGWRKRMFFEVGYFPQGRAQPPTWDTQTRNPWGELPVRIHTTDWHDVMNLVHQAWDEGKHDFIAWPVGQ